MNKEGKERLKLFKKYGYDIPKARRFVLSKAKFGKGSILEIGTGSGHMAVALAKKDHKLTSIDLDRKAQRTAGQNLRDAGLRRSVILKLMDAEKLKFEDGSFDSVISVNFLHHAKAPAKCLKEMIRVAGSIIVFADFNRNGERIAEKIHALDGHTHPRSKMALIDIKKLFRGSGMTVEAYNDTCQYVLVAKKGGLK